MASNYDSVCTDHALSSACSVLAQLKCLNTAGSHYTPEHEAKEKDFSKPLLLYAFVVLMTVKHILTIAIMQKNTDILFKLYLCIMKVFAVQLLIYLNKV